MKEIPLTQGKVALVDDGDFERLNVFKWRARRSRAVWYAYRTKVIKGKKHQIYMHHMVLEVPQGYVGDHRDGDGLNNTRENLRIATDRQNKANRAKPTHKGGKPLTSKFKGVSKKPKHTPFEARIGIRDSVAKKTKSIYLGCFKTEVEAAMAYDRAATMHFGEFARLNFPIGGKN